jgi:hypothetical protein
MSPERKDLRRMARPKVREARSDRMHTGCMGLEPIPVGHFVLSHPADLVHKGRSW